MEPASTTDPRAVPASLMSGSSAQAEAAAVVAPEADASSPRLLVCHDMMGGYLADRLVQGSHEAAFYRCVPRDTTEAGQQPSQTVTHPPPCMQRMWLFK